MTSGSKLLAVVALVSLLTYPALGLEVSQDKDINEPQLEARGTRRNLAAKTAIRKSKLPRKSDAEAQLSFGDKEETTLRMHSPHDVREFAVHERRKRSIEEADTETFEEFSTGDGKGDELTSSVEEEPGVDEEDAIEDSEDDELLEERSAWPKFGIVGERQAALYYSSFLVFSVFLYKNSAGANSRGANTLPKSGRY